MMRLTHLLRLGRRRSAPVSQGALYLLTQWHTGGQIDDAEWRYREHLLRRCERVSAP